MKNIEFSNPEKAFILFFNDFTNCHNRSDMKELNNFIRWYKMFLKSKHEITAEVFFNLMTKFESDEQIEIY